MKKKEPSYIWLTNGSIIELVGDKFSPLQGESLDVGPLLWCENPENEAPLSKEGTA